MNTFINAFSKIIFLKISEHQLTLILLAVCILPVAALAIWALVKAICNRKKLNKKHAENIKDEGVDLLQQNIFFEAYGGTENVLAATLEMNRITIKVSDIDKVDGEKLKELGATGVLLVGDLVKASYGDRAKYVFNLLEKYDEID